MFRRFVSVLLLSVLCLSLVSSALAAGDMQVGSMYVNTANGKALRFRSSRSTSADNILAEIPYGTKVYVLSWDGTWARIRYNSAVGYVVKKHLSIARPEAYATVSARKAAEKAAQEAAREAEKAAREEEKQRQKELKDADAKLDKSRLKSVDPYDVTVLTGVLDLKAAAYQKASLTAAVKAEYSEGTPLTVRSRNSDWALIYNAADDSTAYMLLEDLVADIVEEELLED